MDKSEKIKDFILDIFYPNVCPCCNEFILWNELLCSKCIERLDSLSIIKDEPKEKLYNKSYIYKPYMDIVEKGIFSLKDSSINFGRYCGRKIAEAISEERIDMVIPVPMSAKKKRIRGYNQSEIIAREICKYKNIPLRKDILKMKYFNSAQHLKSSEDRKSIKNYISIKDVNLEGMRIILCDDVITTSSTMNACSELLKQKGAEFIYAVAIAGTVKKYKE